LIERKTIMAQTIKELQELLEKKKAEMNKLKGQEEALLKSLKEKGFKTVEEADKEVSRLGKEIDKLSAEYKTKLEKFEKDFGGFLNA